MLPIQDIGLPHLMGKLTKQIERKASIQTPLMYIIGVVCFIQFGYLVMEYLDTIIFPTFQSYIRNELMKRVVAQSSANYEEIYIAKILMRVSRLPNVIYGYIAHFKSVVLPNLVVFLFAGIYISLYDIWLGVGLLTLVAILVYAVMYTVETCSDVSMARDSSFNVMTDKIDDMLRNMVSVLNTGKHHDELESIAEYQEIVNNLTRDSLYCTNRLRYLFIPLVLTYFGVFCIRLYSQVSSGSMKPSVFIPILLVFLYIMNTFWSVLGSVNDMVIRAGNIRESMHTFDLCEVAAQEARHKFNNMEDILFSELEYDPQQVVLRLDNINYGYKTKTELNYIFNDFSIEFHRGEKTLLMGEIGSGKSTIIKLLMKYHQPQSGEIYYHNVSYNSITPQQIRRMIAYIPQTPILFDRTVYENINYGSNKSKEEVEELMIRIGLEDLLKRLPEGLDTPVGKYGSKLSGGQRQIIWILRAYLQETDVVLMDEPTSAIDEHTKDIVLQLLQTIMVHKTVIMVTHDPYLKKLADRVVELNKGVIISDHRNR